MYHQTSKALSDGYRHTLLRIVFGIRIKNFYAASIFSCIFETLIALEIFVSVTCEIISSLSKLLNIYRQYLAKVLVTFRPWLGYVIMSKYLSSMMVKSKSGFINCIIFSLASVLYFFLCLNGIHLYGLDPSEDWTFTITVPHIHFSKLTILGLTLSPFRQSWKNNIDLLLFYLHIQLNFLF